MLNKEKIKTIVSYYARNGLCLVDFLNDYFTDNILKEYKLTKEEMVEASYEIGNIYVGYCGTEEAPKLTFEKYKKLWEVESKEWEDEKAKYSDSCYGL